MDKNIGNNTHFITGFYDNKQYPENIYELPQAPIIYNDNQEGEFYLPQTSLASAYPIEYTYTSYNTITHYDSDDFPQTSPIAV